MKRFGVILLVSGVAVGAFALAETVMTFDADAKTIVNYRSGSDVEVRFGDEGPNDGRGSDGQSGGIGGGAASGGGGIAGNSGSSGSSASGGSGGQSGGGAGNAGNAGNAGGVGNSASGGMIAHFFRKLLGW